MLFQVLSEAILKGLNKMSLYNLNAIGKEVIFLKIDNLPYFGGYFLLILSKIFEYLFFSFKTTPTAAKVFALLVPFFHKIFPSFQIVYL